MLQESNHLDEAIEAYHRALALDESHANANNLGVLLRAAADRWKLEAHRNAIRLNPEHIDAHRTWECCCRPEAQGKPWRASAG